MPSSHAPRFAVGAAPADIAPPISLRRAPLLKGKQALSASRANTQGGTEVGSSRSIEQHEPAVKSRPAARAQASQEEEEEEEEEEVIVLESEPLPPLQPRARPTPLEKEKANETAKTASRPVDKGKKKAPVSDASPTKSVPQMPVAQVSADAHERRPATTNASRNTNANRHVTGSSSTAMDRFESRDQNRGDVDRNRHERGGYRRGGNSRYSGNGRAASPPLRPRRGHKRAARPPLLELGGLTSWVLVNNRAVELHKIKPKGPMAMSCYICTPTLTPSSQPIEFAVGFRDDRIAAKDAPDILVECIVDGVVVKHEEVVIRALKDDKAARNAQSMRGRTWTWRGRRESKTAIRPFVFSPLKLTEDEDLACSSESIIRQLGTIQLRIFRGKVGTAAKAVGDDGYRTGIEAVQDMRFEETSAKVKGGAVSHQAGLGPARYETTVERSTFEMSPLDSEDKPYATLEFVYRSRAVFEMQGIIPPSKPATPPPAVIALPSAPARLQPNAPEPEDPTDRTESPALILAGRPPSPRLSTSPPRERDAIGIGAPKKEEDEEENAETRRRILVRKQQKREIDERNLGTLVLSDDECPDGPRSDDADDNDDDGDAEGSITHQIKTNPMSSPIRVLDAGKSSRVVSIVTTAAKEHDDGSVATTSIARGAASTTEADEDLEIAQLRAEIAALKRRNELAELRRERDELARMAWLARPTSTEGSIGSATSGPSDKSASQERDSAVRSKRKQFEQHDEEDREVAGLLVRAKRPRDEGPDSAKDECEEVILSDSSE